MLIILSNFQHLWWPSSLLLLIFLSLNSCSLVLEVDQSLLIYRLQILLITHIISYVCQLRLFTSCGISVFNFEFVLRNAWFLVIMKDNSLAVGSLLILRFLRNHLTIELLFPDVDFFLKDYSCSLITFNALRKIRIPHFFW
jgi:hypothetical protein